MSSTTIATTPRAIKFGSEVREELLAGVTTHANAVGATLGPRGRTVSIDRGYGYPHNTKDGVTVAKNIFLPNKFQNMGALMLREVSSKSNEMAGDGTTTSCVLAANIISAGMNHVNNGSSPIELKRGIDKVTKAAVYKLQELSVPCNTTEVITQVGTISANGDDEIGDLIAEAMKAVGTEGIITVEESKHFDDELKVVEGMNFIGGYLSPYFVTDTKSQSAVLTDCAILTVNGEIPSASVIMEIVEFCANNKKPLLVMADNVDGEVLSFLVQNHINKAVQCVVVKSPDFSASRVAKVGDIAKLVGGLVIDTDAGMSYSLTDATSGKIVLGSADKVIVTKHATTIVGGHGDKEELAAHVAGIYEEINSADESDFWKAKCNERIAKLSGGVAVVKVGASTESEMKEKKDRMDDALCATRSAVEEGIVAGGGITMVRISQLLDLNALKLKNDDQRKGALIMLDAMGSPLRKIVTNAGGDDDAVMDCVLESSGNWGYDAATDTYVDMIEAGIIDPTKVTRCALQYASSIAGVMLTTEVLITDYDDSERIAMDHAAANAML